MDWASIVSGALGGGLGSLIGLAITTKIPKTKKILKLIIISLSIVIFSFILTEDPFKKNIRDVFFHQSRFEMMSHQLWKMMEKDEVLAEKFKNLSNDELKGTIMKYSRIGLYWLSEEQMDEWNSFRLVLADSSLSLCAGLMTGKVDEKMLKQSFDVFSDDQIKRWVDLSYAATKAGIVNEARFDHDHAATEFRNGLEEVISLLSKTEGSRFQNILDQYQNISDEEACWATKALHVTARKFPAEQRVVFLRALASFGS